MPHSDWRAYKEKRIRQFRAGEIAPKHGKISTYANFNCRCLACRAARAAYKGPEERPEQHPRGRRVVVRGVVRWIQE
jgi:hypothetical protein